MSKREELAPTNKPAVRERRSSQRIRLTLDVAVPVLVKDDDRIQWGMARNVSEGGMLIELPDPPAIGREVEISFPGIPGSTDAPDHAVLRGEVRHQLKWNFSVPDRSDLDRPAVGSGMNRRNLSAIGVKFLRDGARMQHPNGWVH